MDAPPPDLRSLFTAALDRPAGPERDAYLDEACRGDADLRADVEALLLAHDEVGDFLASPPTADAPAPGPREVDEPEDAPAPGPPAEGVGARIGPYRLLQEIGAGGMGVVFMAEQERPVRRRVALKLIKAGMDTAQVVARFEAERQALALMDHPNIARVLDAGTTDSGRPYFVMELVKGVPITEYCDEARLSPKERLELFIPVCQAIQHAHQKGIIHRDVKPTNVLVTLVDGSAVPKVIDFGVAKAVDQRLTERTLFTQFGAIVGTPEYMSPEQAGISAGDVDTRSDIYSLGVLLYELLTGSTPLERETLRQAAFAEILRRIREEEPPKPSTRLSGSGDRLASLSAVRRTEPARLTRLVRGDLDWIVMKSLEKDRARRYESAAGFARDIRRYLDGDAAEAGPPSARYRLGKFARKHRTALATAAAFALLLTAATVVSAAMAVRASRALRESEQSRRESDAVSDFLVEAFKSHDITVDVTKLRVVEVLDGAVKRLEADVGMPPAIKGKLLHVLGLTYQGLRQYPQAQEVMEKAKAVREAALGQAHRDTLESRAYLAYLSMEAGGKDGAVALGRATLADCVSALGAGDAIAIRARLYLGWAFYGTGRMDEAVARAEEAVRLCEAHQPEGSDITITCRCDIAQFYRMASRHEEALMQLQRVLAVAERTRGPDSLWAQELRGLISDTVGVLGGKTMPHAEREAILARAVERLGPDSLASLLLRAEISLRRYYDRGEDGAIQALRDAIAAEAKKIGPDNPITLASEVDLARVLLNEGRHGEAIAALEGVVARFAKHPRGHQHAIAARRALATAYNYANRGADAIRTFEAQIAAMKQDRGPDNLEKLEDEQLLVDTYILEGRTAEARHLIRQVLDVCNKTYGAGHIRTVMARTEYALLLLAEGRPAEAASAQEEVLALMTKATAFGPVDVAWNHMHLGHMYFEAGDLDRAEAEWREWSPRVLRKDYQDWMDGVGTRSRRGEMPLRRREYAEAEKLIVPGYEFMKGYEALINPTYKPRLAEAGERVVRLYEAWGKPETAAKWRDRIGKAPPGPAEAPGPPPRRPTEVLPSRAQPTETPPRAGSR